MGPESPTLIFSREGRVSHSETGHLLTAWPELSGAIHRTQSKETTDKAHRTRFQSQKVTNSKVKILLLKLENREEKTKLFEKKTEIPIQTHLGHQGAMGRGSPCWTGDSAWALGARPPGFKS